MAFAEAAEDADGVLTKIEAEVMDMLKPEMGGFGSRRGYGGYRRGAGGRRDRGSELAGAGELGPGVFQDCRGSAVAAQAEVVAEYVKMDEEMDSETAEGAAAGRTSQGAVGGCPAHVCGVEAHAAEEERLVQYFVECDRAPEVSIFSPRRLAYCVQSAFP